jgi:LytS/YehU family sensor histidine kinase
LTLYAQTLHALLAPRRLVPILLVCAPMVAAQARFSVKAQAGFVAALVCTLFVAIAPYAWRALFPRPRVPLWPLRILLYGALGGVPALVGYALPLWLDLGRTFIATGINLLVSTALFWVGGWGLARDIELELGLRVERRRADQLAREAEQAQLLAMRAHLDPHFLFNTLNAIAEWCRDDGAVAEQAILQLSAVLRQVLDGVRGERWPLARELAIVRDVLALHRLRDPERFTVDWQVPEPLPDVDIPPLLLLPVVDNAVKHGPAQGYRGAIEVQVEARADQVVLQIANPGPFAGPRPGGEGLRLVQRRLALVHGEAARFAIGGDSERTRAVVTLPVRRQEAR